MCMKLDRKLRCFLQSSYQLCCLIRKQKTCHIFDTDGICTHLFNLFRHGSPVIQGISISQRIGKRYLRMSFFFICCFYSSLKIAKIIHTVKNTDDIDAVCC